MILAMHAAASATCQSHGLLFLNDLMGLMNESYSSLHKYTAGRDVGYN